jgi:protein TonB
MTARALAIGDLDRRTEFLRWSLAAAIVCTAHFGLAAGYFLLPQPEAEGSLASPAVIVELAPTPVAPASQQDLAPGPDMVEAQPTPRPPEQVEPEVVEPTPIPEAPIPAEVTLPKPEPKAVEKTPETEPDKQKSETQVVQENTPAPQTTAAPRSDEQTAAVPAAPSPGATASTRAAIATWRELLLARLQQSKRYPSSAEARREEGIVTLNFTVDRAGHVLARRIAKSSGVASLDDEVMAMVKRAEPLPAFPAAMTQASISLTVPIRFSLR